MPGFPAPSEPPPWGCAGKARAQRSLMERAMSEVQTASPKPVEVGDPAPPFSLPAAQGGTVKLEQAVKNGPVLLWFAPGMV